LLYKIYITYLVELQTVTGSSQGFSTCLYYISVPLAWFKPTTLCWSDPRPDTSLWCTASVSVYRYFLVYIQLTISFEAQTD